MNFKMVRVPPSVDETQWVAAFTPQLASMSFRQLSMHLCQGHLSALPTIMMEFGLVWTRCNLRFDRRED